MKLLRNRASLPAELSAADRIAPREGAVDILPVSLNRFTSMFSVRGHKFDMSFFADDLVFV